MFLTMMEYNIMNTFKFSHYTIIRWCTLFTCLFLLSCTVIKPPSPEARIALVIGNADYQFINPLNNPVNDARDMSQALNDLGFEVVYEENADKQSMETAIETFQQKLEQKRQEGKETVGLFYYSGHGAQDGDRNFLLPVSLTTSPEQPNTLRELETVPLNSVLVGMKQANTTMNIVILDACRNKPDNLMLADGKGNVKSIGKGLHWIEENNTTSSNSTVLENAFIAYATSPKAVAYDEGDNNSPYTQYLLKHIREEGVPIEELFKTVRNAVIEETEERQIPWERSSLKKEFYFAGKGWKRRGIADGLW